MSESNICYTYEGALEAAIQMEEDGFRNYLRALRTVQQKGAKEILRENALDELNHKHQLEKALLDGEVETGVLQKQIPTMSLGTIFPKKELGPESGVREALLYAIHLEKEAADFYRKVADGCEGAPMAKLFNKLMHEETTHMQRLEDIFERHFMTEN